MTTSEIRVEAIPAFTDNYFWLVHAGGESCAVVDPGDAAPVERALEAGRLRLAHILLTHHHPDHVGGVNALLARHEATVHGPGDPRMPPATRPVGEPDSVTLDALGLTFSVLDVPGHTSSHIAYHGHGMLFCGDTLFSVGCGRLFEGTPAEMQASLDKLAALPPETRVYCAHEYTQSNCAFARRVEPDNAALAARCREVEALRREGRRTVPTTLAEERRVNPFLRTREEAVVAAARALEPGAEPGAAVLGVIRAWKDRG